MKKYFKISFLITFLIVLEIGAFAAEDAEYHGAVTIEGRVVDRDGQSAFINPYEDLNDNLLGSFWTNYYKGNTYLELEGKDIGLDHQSYKFKMGQYEKYKLSLLFDKTPNKISMGARTFYTTNGTGFLTYDAVNRPKDTDLELIPNISTDPMTWNKFNYDTQRRKFDGEFELKTNSPYFLRVKFTEDKKTGTQPYGQASSVFPDIQQLMFSQFGHIIEMPEPVAYLTHNASIETGYKSKDLVYQLSGTWSQFENDQEILNWRNPFVTTEEFYEETTLPPDNNFYKFAASLSKKFGYHSVLALRGSYSNTTSDTDLRSDSVFSTDGIGPILGPLLGIPFTMSPVYGTIPIGLSDKSFNGETNRVVASAAFSSRPTKDLDLKAYYKYSKRDNSSDIIVVSETNPEDPTQTGSIENNPYEYTTHKAGLSFGYRAPFSVKVILGYDYTYIDRDELLAAESTTDNELWIELLNRNRGSCSWRVKYTHLDRSSDFGLANAGEDLTDPASIQRFERYYDSTDKNRDAVKFELNFQTTDNIHTGVTYKYSMDDYDETTLGRTEQDKHEVYLDTSWNLPDSLTLTGFIGYERGTSIANKRYYEQIPDTPLGPASQLSTDPAAGTQVEPHLGSTIVFGRDAQAYNFNYEYISDYWSLGFTAEVPIVKDKLDFLTTWRYQIEDGQIDFSSEGPDPVENIDHANDYTQNELDAKLFYNATKEWNLMLGYTYQKIDYEDVQVDGYEYVLNERGLNRYYLSGAYAFQEETNNIFYVGVTYQF